LGEKKKGEKIRGRRQKRERERRGEKSSTSSQALSSFYLQLVCDGRSGRKKEE